MKDCFGRRLYKGDAIAYVVRSGSNVTIERRTVAEVGAAHCKTEVTSDRWIWNEEKGTGHSEKITTLTTLKTPHLIVKLTP